MSMQDQRSTEQPMPRGPRGDVRRLRESGGASVAELREFLQEMRGKSPQEMLGVIAQSDLVRSTITATIAAIVLLVVLTVVPFALSKVMPTDKAATGPAAASTQKPAKADAAPKPDASKPATANAGDAAKPASADPPAKSDDLLNKLGIGEQKNADPNSNPLDGKTDDLLKGLDK
ncbi:MAG: hypothetical protein GC159_17985 [Phycisphaera sp.]|nr:hypothetical protein [Phycisphaera sp.]